MRISVFGLGYVGSVSAACLARDGHSVIGVDPNPTKLALVQGGQAPVIEPGLSELITDAIQRGTLHVTSDVTEAVAASELSFLCVGTPSQGNGSLDTDFVRRVCEEIGEALGRKQARHVVVVRSTVLPGTTVSLVVPTLEKHSGKRAGRDFGVCMNPEFLREGTAVKDFDEPPKTVIGESDPESGELVARLYEALDAPLIRTDLATAEMVKYCDNTWHALKIGFANEVGNIAKALEIDSHRVMEIFCLDRKLNIAPTYLKPGQAFGGSCLPKDVRAFTYKARELDVETPILSAILPSNQLQLQRALKMVLERGKRRVGVLGFSFKAGTDDLRESPVVEMIERLIGKGYDLRLYDRNVHLAKLVGANRQYILERIPHISGLMVETLDEVLAHAETILIGNNDREFQTVLERRRPDQTVIDLVRLRPETLRDPGYDGICW